MTSNDVDVGTRLLEAQDWEGARRVFEGLADTDASALDGLGVALWWLGDVEGSLARREQAFAELRRRGEVERAAMVAIWLAREYQAVHRNRNAVNGWLTRAQTLLDDAREGPAKGRLDLLRAELSSDPSSQEEYADRALSIATRHGDADAEIHGMALRGRARIASGRLTEGISDLDQAMAAAVAGEGNDPQTLGDAFCVMVACAEMLGDFERFAGWAELVEQRMGSSGHVPLLSFCGACCGELFAATGRWQEAEHELVQALEALAATGHRSRCVDPAARLARLRIHQGDLESAEELVNRYPEEPEMVSARVALLLARGEAAAASQVTRRRLNRTGTSTLEAVPLLSLLVEAEVARGELGAAEETAASLMRFAELSQMRRVRASAELAEGRVRLARAERGRALGHLESALGAFLAEEMPLEASLTRLVIAAALLPEDEEAAVAEARASLEVLERLGARRSADSAAAFLRELGVRARTGAKHPGSLSAREKEVLGLLRYGLSNAEIGERLFISGRTVGHHVSSILRKLGVRSRAEAAALAGDALGTPE